MANLDIRNYAKSKNVNLWQVSKQLGYAHETAFSRVLRYELTEDKKKEIKDIIDYLSLNKSYVMENIICPFCGEKVLNKRFCYECGEMLKEMEE